MSSGAEKRSAFQLINDHIKSLEQELKYLDDKEKNLDKLKVNAQEDIHQKYDSLVNTIKTAYTQTIKQLDELYQEQKRKLEEARQKLIERKIKAETELIVDHKPVEIPEVRFNYTINIESASRAIDQIKLPTESGRNAFFPLLKQETKAESVAVGGFAFCFPSKSSDSAITPTFTSLSIPSVVPHQSNEPTTKRKKKKAAAETESPSHPSPSTPKMTIHTLRDFIRCRNCHKPRCIYSGKKLTKDDQEYWNRLKGILPYRCGANLFPTAAQNMAVEQTDCTKDVSFQYFSHDRMFPAVCYHCGVDISSNRNQMSEEKQTDVIIHEVCHMCKASGIKARTRKKKSPIKKANIDKSWKSNLLF